MEQKNSKNIKRQVAFKVRINDLINGRYVKEEGWEPNYIITKGGKKISRINVMGTVVARSNGEAGNYECFVLDDGSGRVSIREFREGGIMSYPQIGEVVMLIGRPREYGNEKYIMPEIIKKIEDGNWIKVRGLELEKNKEEAREEIEIQEEVVEKNFESEEAPLSQRIYDAIKKEDRGNGVETETLVNSYGEGAEETIKGLLARGEIFEIRPGRLKVLE